MQSVFILFLRFISILALTVFSASTGHASPESEAIVHKAYIAYYARPADPAGLNYWANRLDQEGGNLDGLINDFGSSSEYTERFAALSQQTLINNLYLNLFNRGADSAGLNYYLGLLASGQSTLAEISLVILNGAVNDDLVIIENKRRVAEYYTAAVAAGRTRYEATAAQEILSSVDSEPVSVTQATAQIDNNSPVVDSKTIVDEQLPSVSPVGTIIPDGSRILAAQCFQCHGTNGNSSTSIDSLLGESENELVEEMLEMQQSSNTNDIMHRQARGYTVAQIRAMAAYIAALDGTGNDNNSDDDDSDSDEDSEDDEDSDSSDDVNDEDEEDDDD